MPPEVNCYMLEDYSSGTEVEARVMYVTHTVNTVSHQEMLGGRIILAV